MRRWLARSTYALALTALCLSLAAQVKEIKPGFNLFSKEQDIQIGKEGAAEVEKTMQVINNDDLKGYISRIGDRLAKSQRAGGFPYKFSVVNDKSINAFALPGGPMYIHTGLIAAADNESQLAGVMAHEMSHVALRHGTNQASKANLWQLPAMIASGMLGEGSMIASLGQLGIGLGVQSVLLKYSRDAEKQADLNGAQMMNEVGYNPTEMAKFFQKLEAEGQRDNSKLANFLSDHPTPGNRVAYVNDQNKLLPKVQFSELDPGGLTRAKSVIAGLPAPPVKNTNVAGAGGGSAPAPTTVRPSGKYKQFSGGSFSLNYPDNWEVFAAKDDPNSATIAPRAAVLQGQGGEHQIGYGMITGVVMRDQNKPDLNRETTELIRQLQQGNPSMKQSREGSRSANVGGQKALVTQFESKSPYQGEASEVDALLTVARPNGLFYLVFISPRSEWDMASAEFNNIIKDLNFK
jgi:beta-barrel assembly-enhancing protease